jgi:hypothetical protein
VTLGFCEHIGPIRSQWLNPEIGDGKPQELLNRDSTRGAVRRREFLPRTTGGRTDVQMRKSNRAAALRVPVVGDDLLAVPVVENVIVLLCYKRRTPQKGQPGSCRRM